MAKVYVVNGVRCVPETNGVSPAFAKLIVSQARKTAIERADLHRTILEVKANEILKSL